MIIANVNPTELILQAVTDNADGSPKTDITAAHVRVYYFVSGVETNVLTSTVLSQVGSSNTWRYRWATPTIARGNYIAEYTLVDSNSITNITTEEISIGYLSDLLGTLQSNVTTLLNIEQGRWEITGNQMIFYGTDAVTPILTFNLFDSDGNPTMTNVAERVKV